MSDAISWLLFPLARRVKISSSLRWEGGETAEPAPLNGMTSSMPRRSGDGSADRLPFHAVRVDRVRRLCRDAASLDRPFDLERRTACVDAIDPRDPRLAPSDRRSEDPRLQFREVDPLLASRGVATAIERTDADLAAPVGDEYSAHRAIAIARVTAKATALTRPIAS